MITKQLYVGNGRRLRKQGECNNPDCTNMVLFHVRSMNHGKKRANFCGTVCYNKFFEARTEGAADRVKAFLDREKKK